MLSKDELSDGVTFILKLTDTDGVPAQWVAKLSGSIAASWFAIYRNADWAALRAHGAEVFHDRVTESEAEHIRRRERCVVIHTSAVRAEDIEPPTERPKPLQADWENDGGSLAPMVLLGREGFGTYEPPTRTVENLK